MKHLKTFIGIIALLVAFSVSADTVATDIRPPLRPAQGYRGKKRPLPLPKAQNPHLRATPKAPSTAKVVPKIVPKKQPIVPAPTPTASKPRVLLGIDVLEKQHFQPLFFDSARKKPKRVGLLCNIASVNGKGILTSQVLKNAPGVNLVALFAAENGLTGNIKNGKVITNGIDPQTGLPVYSLHGKTRAPVPEMLVKIDVLVIDLQDIGCRSYTFISAMRFALEACFNAGKEVIVLDRPNPLGGIQMDGPIMEDAYVSYTGAFRIPYVHGMTIGELAQLVKIDAGHPRFKHFLQFKRKRGQLIVIRMQGWQRWMLWKDTGLQWVPPSSSMRSPDTAAMYSIVGFGCIGSRFSHGARSATPFQLLRHKDPHPTIRELCRVLTASHVPHFAFQEMPKGVLATLKDWNKIRPMDFALRMMQFTKLWSKDNPYQSVASTKTSYTSRIIGSAEFLKELASPRKTIRIDYFLKKWRLDSLNFREYIQKNHCFLY